MCIVYACVLRINYSQVEWRQGRWSIFGFHFLFFGFSGFSGLLLFSFSQLFIMMMLCFIYSIWFPFSCSKVLFSQKYLKTRNGIQSNVNSNGAILSTTIATTTTNRIQLICLAKAAANKKAGLDAIFSPFGRHHPIIHSAQVVFWWLVSNSWIPLVALHKSESMYARAYYLWMWMD